METRTVKFTSKEAHNYPESFWERDVHYITNVKAVPAGEDACNIQVTLEDLKVTLESTEPLDAEWTLPNATPATHRVSPLKTRQA